MVAFFKRKTQVKILFVIFFLFSVENAIAFRDDTSKILRYQLSLSFLTKHLKENGFFKTAVLVVENTFTDTFSISYFEKYLKNLSDVPHSNVKNTQLRNYRSKDSLNLELNYSIFHLITDSSYLYNDTTINILPPYLYDFTDSQGEKDWTNTFVTKLLVTHKGNCRSLTYLYKILADELGAKCWLALAPNHIYIRNYSKQIGWYNTELTSGTFPTDAWIAATGYVSTDAIRSGVYMDTLSNQQSIGLCILDLAQGYLKQTNNYTDGFVLKCCNLVLQYHAVNPEALLIKAEVLKRTYLNEKEVNNINAQTIYNEMEQTYITLVKLGYREMPYKTYLKWLKSVKEDKEKYLNKKINATNKK